LLAELSGWALLVDDHPLMWEGTATVVRSALPGCEVVIASTIAGAESQLIDRAGCRLILAELNLPDARGYSGLLQLQRAAPETPIVMLSSRRDRALVEAARTLGASGFILTRDDADTVARYLRAVLEGETCFPGTGAD